MITYKKIGSNGRFGNQLFQYATLYAVSKTLGCDFGVPYKSKSNNEYSKFYLPECFPNLTAKDSSEANILHILQERGFKFDDSVFSVPDNTDINGYFQSEKYFINYKDKILSEYVFNKQIQQKAFKIRSLAKSQAISIHLRLGDYLNLQDCHPVCSIKYYQESLSMVPNDLLIYVFSDDLEKAKKFFDFMNRDVIFVEGGDKYVEMCLMSLCDYHIIANSSFSWWGAWLSNSKKTIAPARWFGDSLKVPQNWSDIYCRNWIVV